MPNRKTQKEKRVEERQEQILKAAGEVFTRKGYEAATIPEIARAAGLATGTIYLYFSNKRELFISVVKNTIFTTPLLNLIGKIPTGDFAEVFKNILLDRFELAKTETVRRMPAIIGEVWRDEELKELWLKEFLHPFLGKMEAAYKMLSVSGKARRLEPPVVVRVIGGMVLGFLMLGLMEGDTSPLKKLPPEKVAGTMVDFVLHGLINNTAGKKDENT